MEEVREIVRGILKEMFLSEAHPSTHYNERVAGRLKSEYLTEPKFDFDTIKNSLAILQKINFEPDKEYAIFMRPYNQTYKSREPITGHVSIGSDLWALVKNNTIITVMFRRKDQRNDNPIGYDTILNMKSLEQKYHEAEKDENLEADFKDFKRQGAGTRKKISLDFPVIEVNGKKWYVDEKNEEIIYTKNIKKKVSFSDLTEDVLEKVIDAVVKV